ncbi:sensor histidine kinase [Granulicella sibirica]|uniref:Two-component system sensor protein n=1 Tax=Granulicella sibirica TaxID=2479048 RepID=A0A4Q0T7N7_9BACT|nr:sensor histidine kinase [Granulicella sibirica]RXH58730.1 two-component system sensor protein [Granulicella sibirica]
MYQIEDRTRNSVKSLGEGPQSKRDYIWLAYSIFFFIDPVMNHNRTYWIENIVLYLVFLGVYVGCMQAVTTRTSLYWVPGFTILGLIAYPINGGASSFFVYTAAILPMCISSMPLVAALLIGQSGLVIAEGIYFHLNWLSIGSTIGFIAVIGVSNSFVGQQKRADAKLRMAHEEIEQLAAMAERERIARDLHDVLGHTLSVVVLKAELAGRLLKDGPSQDVARAMREIGDVEATGRTALKEVREAIGGYRSQGLAAELELARRTLDAAGVALRCEAKAAKEMTVTQETVLSLAVREAVTNIVRHAEASVCRVSLATEGGFHALKVEDDGTHKVEREGNGLRGMRERVDALGGVFLLESGKGTRLMIRLPIVEAAR